VTHGPLQTLLEHRARFLSFIHARVGERSTAEDILQSAYTRLLEQPPQIPAGHEVPWFYRVLRNAVVDRHRRETSEGRRHDAWLADPTRTPDQRAAGRLCRCTLSALASLKPQYVRIIEQVDLEGRVVTDIARSEGLSPTNAYVRLHRARRQLADRLRTLCRHCADNACADCHCKDSGPPA